MFSGVRVYDVSTQRGFSLRGKVAHDPAADWQLSCSTWWTRASSEVKRNLFFEDYLFSISTERMKVNHLDALEQDITVFKLQ